MDVLRNIGESVRGWEEAMVSAVADLGMMLWAQEKQIWLSKKMEAQEQGKEFNREETTFVEESSFWTMMVEAFPGARDIMAQNLSDDA